MKEGWEGRREGRKGQLKLLLARLFIALHKLFPEGYNATLLSIL
jgi:hypothetical protein